MDVETKHRIANIRKSLRKIFPFIPMKRLIISRHCICENEIKPLDEDSNHEIIIRRYVGQFGHLIDVYYHKACYLHHENMWASLGDVTYKETTS